MDFGLAKTHDFEEITESGMIAGSPSYIAPEVWDSAPFDHRIDVYSLAAVVFRTLAGRPPFMADSTLDLYHLATTAPRPSLSAVRNEMPAAIDDWVARALAVQAVDRYPDVASMWSDFAELALQSETPSVRWYHHHRRS